MPYKLESRAVLDSWAVVDSSKRGHRKCKYNILTGVNNVNTALAVVDSIPGTLDDVGRWRSRCDARPRSDVASSRCRAACRGTWRVSSAVSVSRQDDRPQLCFVALSADVDDDSLTAGRHTVVSSSCLPFHVVDRRHLEHRWLGPPCVLFTATSTRHHSVRSRRTVLL